MNDSHTPAAVPTYQQERRGQSRSLLNNFWVGRVLFARVLPIMLWVFATYNSAGYSYFGWALAQLQNFGNPGADNVVYILISLIAFLGVGGTWWYILIKAWQGVGAHLLKAAVLPTIAGLLLWLMVAAGWLNPSGHLFIALIEIVAGLVIGIMFSMTIIDRYLSGTTATTSIVQEDETHPHH